MDDVHIRISLCRCAHTSQCDQMLSADHKRQLPVVQDIIRTFPDLLQYFLRASDRQFQITAVVYDIFRQLFILVRTVDLQSVRIVPYRLTGEPRAGTKRRRRVKGRAKDHDPCLLIFSITADKIHCILPHHLSTSSNSAST